MAKETVARISLGESGELKFRTWLELGKWLANEEKAWSWLEDISGYPYSAREEILGNIEHLIEGVRQMSESEKIAAKRVSTKPLFEDGILEDVKHFEALIANGSYILASSPLGVAIAAEAENDPYFATVMANLAIMHDSDDADVPASIVAMKAISALTAFERGWDKTSTVQSQRLLQKLSKQYSGDISKLDNDARDRLETLDNSIGEYEVVVGNSSASLTETLEKYEKIVGKRLNDIRNQAKAETDKLQIITRAEMAEFKDFYEAEISLQGPVEYWKRKSKSHKKATGWTAGAFLIYCAICIGFLYNHFASYDGGFHGFLEFWKGANIASFGAFASVIALALAFARILYRMFASQLHLWNDCSERVTMIETYLALAQKGHAKEEFLGALLARLFSPSSDGVVKDDLGPVGPVDAIGKHFAK